MFRLNLNFKILGKILVCNTWVGVPSFLALVHHPNLRLSVSTGFYLGHHRGLSHERPVICYLQSHTTFFHNISILEPCACILCYALLKSRGKCLNTKVISPSPLMLFMQVAVEINTVIRYIIPTWNRRSVDIHGKYWSDSLS